MTDALEKLQALRDKVGSLDRVAPLVSAELSTDIGDIIASLSDEGDARAWNERVAVCAKHAPDIVDRDCVICELENAGEGWVDAGVGSWDAIGLVEHLLMMRRASLESIALPSGLYAVRLRPVQDGEGEG